MITRALTPEYSIAILPQIERTHYGKMTIALLEQPNVNRDSLSLVLEEFEVSEKFKRFGGHVDYKGNRDWKIRTYKDVRTPEDMWELEEHFHHRRAKIPFEKKIEMVVQMRKNYADWVEHG